jgi:hypothetical protein
MGSIKTFFYGVGIGVSGNVASRIGSASFVVPGDIAVNVCTATAHTGVNRKTPNGFSRWGCGCRGGSRGNGRIDFGRRRRIHGVDAAMDTNFLAKGVGAASHVGSLIER